MWKSQTGPYGSTSHLFVYGSSAVEGCTADALDPLHSDSGYADSTQSASSSTPEPIYYCASELRAGSEQQSAGCDYQIIAHQMESLCVAEEVEEQCSQVTEQEITQLENFYKGHKTQIHVCKSLANLYQRTSRTLLGLTRYSSQPDLCRTSQERRQDCVSDWQLRYTGIPLILHDSGTTKSRDRPRIQLVLAERGTGFALWRDTIDNLSNYEAPAPGFHTMRISTDHRLIVGLSFDSPEAARIFHARLERLTSDPANICLSLPKKDRKSRFCSFWSLRILKNPKIHPEADREPKKKKLLRKSDISMPCFFQHVTAVESEDQDKFFSLQAFLM